VSVSLRLRDRASRLEASLAGSASRGAIFTLRVTSKDRKTPPFDLGPLARQRARDTNRELPAAQGTAGSFDIPLAGIPDVVMTKEQIVTLPLDARHGFVLSLVDGVMSVADILDVCGIDRVDAIEIVAALVRSGVVSLRVP
jgi:hypothetical protein